LYLMRRVLVVPLLAVDAQPVVLLLLPAVRRLDVQAAVLRLLLVKPSMSSKWPLPEHR
jgi:hypothetical protein